MNELFEIISLLMGFMLRLGLPIVVTVLGIMLLQRLDSRWQLEAEKNTTLANLKPGDYLNKVHCWDIRECSPETRSQCSAYQQPDVPCWESHRVGGKLQESCRSCAIRKRVVAISTVNL